MSEHSTILPPSPLPLPPGTDPQDLKWQALVRANILSTTTNKFYRYIALVDQKAMGLIALNSIIVPLAMRGITMPEYKLASTIALVSGILSVLQAIICIFPQRGVTPAKGKRRLLHFSDIGSMSEEEYLTAFWPVYNDKDAFAIEVLRDIHDVSKRVLIPKFQHLMNAYAIFFVGNLAAILVFLLHQWF
jgi:hypothetical protein